jgi:type II secretory ATPase GspE/PulE/Tfp pilus assembly ATPase PilB-like protein
LSLKLADFQEIDARLSGIFEANGWVEGESLIHNLEKYKIVNLDSFYDRIRKLFPDVVRLETLTLERSPTSLVSDIERRYGVIVLQNGKDSVMVVQSLYMDVSERNLNFELQSESVAYARLTPYCFNKLKGVKDKLNPQVVLKRLTHECILLGGTDMHFSVRHNADLQPEYYCSFRIGNIVKQITLFDFDREFNSELIRSIIQKNTQAVSSDIDTIQGVIAKAMDVFGDGKVTLRIATMAVHNGIMLTCRIQEFTTTSMVIGDLGFSQEIQDDLYYVARKRSGVTFITGARRTGKNTTAFAIANEMAKEPIEIADFSSPVETLMPFTQVDYSANNDHLINLTTLAKKLDLDVIFINEIPNKEIAESVRDLVNSSMHTITTFHIDRLWHLPYKLEEYFGKDFKNFLSQINMCANQKMIEKQCPHCSHQSAVSELPPRYRDLLYAHGVSSHYVRQGCARCEHTGGFVGVQPYMERLVFDRDFVRELLTKRYAYEMEDTIYEYMHQNGLVLEKSLCLDVGKGLIAVEQLDWIL